MNVKKIYFFKKAFIAFIAIFVMACSSDFQTVNEPFEISDLLSDEADFAGKQSAMLFELSDNVVVSPEEATSVSEKFLNSQNSRKINSKNFSIQTIREGHDPLVYIFNYADGGFTIVSACRDFFPILAFSEDNSFIIEEEMGGVTDWLKEIEFSIKNSNSFDDGTKSSIAAMWKCFEDSEDDVPIILKRNDAESALLSRLSYLKSQYGYLGFTIFERLSNSQSYFGNYPSLWSGLCSVANAYSSPTNYTIVGLKFDLVGKHTQYGPLLSTQWNQGYPFNYLNNGTSIGCLPVAMAQVMRYHQWPANFNWINMPNSYNGTNASAIINSDLPSLMQNIRSALGMVSGQTGAYVSDAKIAFQNYGYTVTQSSHYIHDVRLEILNNNRPVLMTGHDASVGHAWVCDGIHTTYVNISYFVEYMVDYKYGSYTYSIPSGQPTPTNPGNAANASGTVEYTYFHMNWGWGGSRDAWFLNNDIDLPGQGNYNTSRINLYIKR